MSEDGYGLDKVARLAAKESEEPGLPIRLEPEFPFEVVAFDPGFFGLETFASD
ncbi:MAG: hypothetical protein KDK97_07710 [Verrucomicrobiales bacterium]|nr:hypothetical protein [Verrucomicrobiales bacterium]MCP5560685.1 hypothetical protein [Verrucomicrobiaceae bacterium]